MQSLVFQSSIGPIRLSANTQGLTELSFASDAAVGKCNGVTKSDNAHIEAAVQQLEEYLAGQRKQFTVPVLPHGTPFQQRVWQALQQIPYGQTWSYKELAERVDRPKGFQAVGQANGRNPIAIIIPCHRVIAADGTLGGYAGGLAVKRSLLAIEGLKCEG